MPVKTYSTNFDQQVFLVNPDSDLL